MKDTSPAGARSPLEVRIDRKAFTSAGGTVTEVLRNISFRLEPSTFTCLIGPSGCGKTTTLRILLGLDHDFTGSVSLPGGAARIAAAFQEPRLLPWRTVGQNVRLALPPGSEPDLDGLFEILGLTDAVDRYPGELSLGLERRVALARAFAIDPDVLFLDEPFVSLDNHTASRLRALLIDLWRARGSTVLMVTHNVREALELADRILLFNGHPAGIVGDIAVPVERSDRHGPILQQLVDRLAHDYPETIRA